MKESISICLKCGYVSVLKKERYCPGCGTKLIQKCHRCGEHIEHPMAQYCPVCGAKYALTERKRA